MNPAEVHFRGCDIVDDPNREVAPKGFICHPCAQEDGHRTKAEWLVARAIGWPVPVCEFHAETRVCDRCHKYACEGCWSKEDL